MRIEARIDLGRLEKNCENMYANLKGAASGEKAPLLYAVIKADGYGHGAVPIARRLDAVSYIKGFAVATIEEALEISTVTDKPVLILGCVFPECYEELISNDIRAAVFKYEQAKALSETAEKLGKEAIIHVKLDTGMGRIGLRPSPEALKEIKRIAALPCIRMEGLFTHLAKADMTDRKPTQEQLALYLSFKEELIKAGVSFEIYHYLNSAGIIRFADYGGDCARAGISIYGLWPSEEVERDIADILPVMSLKSRIAYIKDVKEGTAISYGGTFVTDRPSRIATIPAGYADGVPRSLSGKGSVLIHGKRAPILGRVCMDQFMVDVTDIPEAAETDEVTLIGAEGTDNITFEEWQEITGLLNYELSCHIGKRVPRVYD